MSTKPVEQDSGPEIPVKSFTTQDCGQYSGTATGSLPIDSQMSINGSTDLSNCIVGPSGAYVRSIHFKSRGGIRHGEIIVWGAGPSGIGSGTLDLVFISANGERHTIGIFSSSPGEHTDRFRDTSNLVAVSWSHG